MAERPYRWRNFGHFRGAIRPFGKNTIIGGDAQNVLLVLPLYAHVLCQCSVHAGFLRAFSIIGRGIISKFEPLGSNYTPCKKGKIVILYCIPHFCMFYCMHLFICTFSWHHTTLNSVESIQSAFLFPALTWTLITPRYLVWICMDYYCVLSQKSIEPTCLYLFAVSITNYCKVTRLSAILWIRWRSDCWWWTNCWW